MRNFRFKGFLGLRVYTLNLTIHTKLFLKYGLTESGNLINGSKIFHLRAADTAILLVAEAQIR